MAGLCDSTVLTGQDGMIQFKPPGTSVCVRDFSAFGTDGDATHITMPCTHDFRVNDIVIFREEQGGNLDSALQGSTRTRAATGEILKIGTFVAGAGYPASLTNQACTFTGGTGTGATGTITTDAGGQVTAVTLTDGGSGYLSIDQLSVAIDANITSGAGFLVEVDTVSTATGTASAYYVVARTEDWIAVSSSQNGTAISMNGDGGTGSADTELPPTSTSNWRTGIPSATSAASLLKCRVTSWTSPLCLVRWLQAATSWLLSVPPNRVMRKPPAPSRCTSLATKKPSLIAC